MNGMVSVSLSVQELFQIINIFRALNDHEDVFNGQVDMKLYEEIKRKFCEKLLETTIKK